MTKNLKYHTIIGNDFDRDSLIELENEVNIFARRHNVESVDVKTFEKRSPSHYVGMTYCNIIIYNITYTEKVSND